MPGKWTPAQRRKFQATMKAKREATQSADFIPVHEGDVIHIEATPVQDHKAKVLELIDKAFHLLNKTL